MMQRITTEKLPFSTNYCLSHHILVNPWVQIKEKARGCQHLISKCNSNKSLGPPRLINYGWSARELGCIGGIFKRGKAGSKQQFSKIHGDAPLGDDDRDTRSGKQLETQPAAGLTNPSRECFQSDFRGLSDSEGESMWGLNACSHL